MHKRYKLLIAYGNDPGINLGILKNKKNEEISVNLGINPSLEKKEDNSYKNLLERKLFDSIYEKCLEKHKPTVAIIQEDNPDSLKVRIYFAPEIKALYPEELFNKKSKLVMSLKNGYIVAKSLAFK